MSRFDAQWLADQRRQPVGADGRPRVLSEIGCAPVLSSAAVRSEEDEQRDVITWRDASDRPELALLFHVPNGELRTKGVGGRLRAMGTLAGVPDLLLAVPRGRFCGLAIEMKGARADGSLGDTTPRQRSVLDLMERWGWAVAVCWTSAQATAAITEYLDDPEAVVSGS